MHMHILYIVISLFASGQSKRRLLADWPACITGTTRSTPTAASKHRDQIGKLCDMA